MCPQVPCDLLVGADGGNSLVRSQLQATTPSNYVCRIRHKGVYTTTGVAVPADELPGHAFFEIHSFEVRQTLLDEPWRHDTVMYLQLSCGTHLLVGLQAYPNGLKLHACLFQQGIYAYEYKFVCVCSLPALHM